MNSHDYLDKIKEIVANEDKFTKIDKDPTPMSKAKLNKLITTANARTDCKLPKPSGHITPGYIYGNPKTHKNVQNPPLGPIVSQVGTVT